MSERREPKPPRMGWHPMRRKPAKSAKFWEIAGWDVFSPEMTKQLTEEMLPCFDPTVKNNPPIPKLNIDPDEL